MTDKLVFIIFDWLPGVDCRFHVVSSISSLMWWTLRYCDSTPISRVSMIIFFYLTSSGCYANLKGDCFCLTNFARLITISWSRIFLVYVKLLCRLLPVSCIISVSIKRIFPCDLCTVLMFFLSLSSPVSKLWWYSSPWILILSQQSVDFSEQWRRKF